MLIGSKYQSASCRGALIVKIQKKQIHKKIQVQSKYYKNNRKYTVQVKAGLFDFLIPKAKVDPELLDELVELSYSSNNGRNVSSNKKDRIEELVEEIVQYCPRNPTKNNLIFGSWEPIYTSKASAMGGPIINGFFGGIFADKKFSTTINPDKSYSNLVQYKTLGLVDGYASEGGTLKVTGGNTYQVIFESTQLKTFGDVQERPQVNRILSFIIQYLDEDNLVVKFKNEEEDYTQTFVFRRITDEEDAEGEEEEEEEDDEEEDEVDEELEIDQDSKQKQKGGFQNPFGFMKQKSQGVVNQAEQFKQEAPQLNKNASASDKMTQQIDNISSKLSDMQDQKKQSQKAIRDQSKTSQGLTKDADKFRSRQAQLNAKLEELQEQQKSAQEQEQAIIQELRKTEQLQGQR